MDDRFVVEQTIKGNTQAFCLVVLRYQRPLFKFIQGLGVEVHIAEEIAQETFLRVYQSLADYDEKKGASFSTWIFIIGKRLAINHLARSENKYQFIACEDFEYTDEANLSPLESISAIQRQEWIREAIEMLPSPFQSAIVLSYLEELSMTEIAHIEQCSLGTVKSRIHRAKKQLMKILVKKLEENQ